MKNTGIHNLSEIEFDGDYMYIKVDGRKIKIQISKVSQKLSMATEQERKIFKISPSGYGIHWPLIDEDLSIDGLLKNTHNV